MPDQVRRQGLDVVAREAELVDTDELGPAEAVGAVGVTGLAASREEEDRLPVLVLAPRDRLTLYGGDVELLLTRRVRVHSQLNGTGRTNDLVLTGAADHEVEHPIEVVAGEHADLGEDELVDRIRRNVAPIDELLEDVLIDAERQHRGYRLERENLIAREPLQPRETIDVLSAVGAEPRGSVRRLTRHKSSPSLRGPVEERFTPELVKRRPLVRHPDRSSMAASRVEGLGERDIAGSFSRKFEFGAYGSTGADRELNRDWVSNVSYP